MSTTLPRVAIIGATGAVGQTLMHLLDERDTGIHALSLVASSRSAGRLLQFRDRQYRVVAVEDFDFSTVDIAFFSAGSAVSEKWAPVAAQAGALVIDNTNAFRMDSQTPLAVPQVNGHLLRQRPASGIVANPNCSTIPLTRLLRPIHERWGVSSVVVSTYQAASGRGLMGLEELREDTANALQDPDSQPVAECFPPGLGFNVVPVIDRLLDDGFTLEEQKMRQEARKILDLPHLRFTATCARVPVRNGHSEAAYIESQQPVDQRTLLDILDTENEVMVHGATEPGAFPTPRGLLDPDQVHVGRVRVAPDDPHGMWLWLVADNLRVGAALNALQIAGYLAREGVV